MRVLHVDTGREWRGGQAQLLALVRAAPGEHHVALPPDAPLRTRLEAAGVPVVPIDFRGRWRGGRGLARRVAELRPDLIAAHTAHAAFWADRVGGAPVVAHRRVDFVPRSPARYARAAGVVAVSEAVAAVLRRAGVPADRVVVVPDGVAPPEGDPDPVGVRAELGLAADAPLVLAVGALVAHKGHRTLVEALPSLPGVQAVVLGEGPLRAALSRRARALGVDDRLRLPGWRPDVGRWLRSVDVVCAPSLEEGLGQAVVEAAVVGARLVTTSAGGLPEAGAGVARVVPPGDPRALARALREALDEAGEPSERRAARARLRERFSVARMAEDTLHAYARFAVPWTGGRSG